jgi:hypothetical protein
MTHLSSRLSIVYPRTGEHVIFVLEGDVRVRIDYVHRCSYILRAEPGTRQPRLAACLGSSAVRDRVQHFVSLPQIPMANLLQEHAFSIPVLSVEGDHLASHADDHAGLVSLMVNQACSVHILVRMRTYSACVVLQSAYRRLNQLWGRRKRQSSLHTNCVVYSLKDHRASCTRISNRQA